MFDIKSHTSAGHLIRNGRSFPVEYEVCAVKTYRLRISGTVRTGMDAFPNHDELQVADLRLENGQQIRIMFQNVDALNGVATFYLNRANS